MGSKHSKTKKKDIKGTQNNSPIKQNIKSNDGQQLDTMEPTNGNISIDNRQYMNNKEFRKRINNCTCYKRENMDVSKPISNIGIPTRMFRTNRIDKTTMTARRLRKKWSTIAKFKKRLRKRNLNTTQVIITLAKFLRTFHRRSRCKRRMSKPLKTIRYRWPNGRKTRFWNRKRRRRKFVNGSVTDNNQMSEQSDVFDSSDDSKKEIGTEDPQDSLNTETDESLNYFVFNYSQAEEIHSCSDDDEETSYHETSILLRKKSISDQTEYDSNSSYFFESLLVGIRRCCSSVFFKSSVTNTNDDYMCLIGKKPITHKNQKPYSIPNFISDKDSFDTSDLSETTILYVNKRRTMVNDKFNKRKHTSDWWSPILDERKFFNESDDTSTT